LIVNKIIFLERNPGGIPRQLPGGVARGEPSTFTIFFMEWLLPRHKNSFCPETGI